MVRERWLRLSEIKLSPKRAKALLKEWQDRLGMGNYAFKVKLTKDKWDGGVRFLVGVHYGEIHFSTERALVHELIEAILLRYYKLTGLYKYCTHASDNKNTEYTLRHIALFQIVNALLKLKYGE